MAFLGVRSGTWLGAAVGVQGAALWLLLIYEKTGFKFCPEAKPETLDIGLCSNEVNTAFTTLVCVGVAGLNIAYGARAGSLLSRGRGMWNALTLGVFGSTEEQHCENCQPLITSFP